VSVNKQCRNVITAIKGGFNAKQVMQIIAPNKSNNLHNLCTWNAGNV